MPPPINPTYGGMSNQSLLGGVLGALPIVGGLVSGVSQMFTNSANRRWQEKMYSRQRTDALADWEMQNAYNNPAAQMERLKSAGLNPNMVYGHGADAQSAAMPRSSNMSPGNAQAPDFSTGQGGLFYATDMAIRQQQLQNLKVANAAMIAGINNKDADTANKILGNSYGKATYETRISTADAILRNINTRSDVGVSQQGLNLMSLDFQGATFGDRAFKVHQDAQNAQQLNVLRDAANARAESQNVVDLKLKAANVISVLAQAAKTKQEKENLVGIAAQIRNANSLQELDIYMKRAGFTWNDPVILRQLRMKDKVGRW